MPPRPRSTESQRCRELRAVRVTCFLLCVRRVLDVGQLESSGAEWAVCLSECKMSPENVNVCNEANARVAVTTCAVILSRPS